MATTTEEEKPEAKVIDPAAPPTPADKEAEKKFSQEELDRHIAERLEREQKKRAKDAEKAAEEARLKALEESKDVTKLAEERGRLLAEREKELAELRTKAEQGERAAAALRKQLDAAMVDVPEHIKALLATKPEADQLEWLAENKAKLAPAAQPEKDVKKRIPGTPQPDDGKKLSDAEEEKRKAAHAAQVRGMF
jgi:colicin import membrane protein